MSSAGEQLCCLDLDAITPAQLRSRLQALLDGDRGPRVPGLPVADAIQVADELVSNALRHGLPPRTCTVTLSPEPRLLIEVTDSSPDLPHIRPADDSGGLGLLLIDQMSAAWGCLRDDDGKTVWAELVADPSA
ncbi:ATP-binding protein [Nocardia blacklockiae]|uniref:ATP-binding protein n=1 Tax=Nocardia blacklockiae TaxID=480036 RepID=UPI001893EA7C|nr:ATP-binding protein [Nocardia blacklockiae]